MSWIDKSENFFFEIETGDKKKYKPLWRPDGRTKEFNVSLFEYIGLEGTHVTRKKSKSNKYNLVFWFQSENYLTESLNFELSSIDNRYWRVNHPYYGSLIGQPISMTRKDQLNSCEFNVEFIESILADKRPLVSPLEIVKLKSSNLNDKMSTSFQVDEKVSYENQSSIRSSVDDIKNQFNFNLSNEIYSEVVQRVSNSYSTIDSIFDSASSCISSINELISLPNKLILGVDVSVGLFLKLYESFKGNFVSGSNKSKKFFESVGSFVVANICESLLSFEGGSINTRRNLDTQINMISTIYRDYLLLVDNEVQSNFEAQSILNEIVFSTISNLINQMQEASQERYYLLEKDYNLIPLVHKLTGLDLDDKNINEFIEVNKISKTTLFLIQKGTRVLYYIK